MLSSSYFWGFGRSGSAAAPDREHVVHQEQRRPEQSGLGQQAARLGEREVTSGDFRQPTFTYFHFGYFG